MEHWARAFALTQLVELPIYFWLLAVIPARRRLGVAFAASAFTHPWLWFILPALLQHWLGFWGYLVVGECLVFGVEAALLIGVGVPGRAAAVAAALANAGSCLAGLALL